MTRRLALATLLASLTACQLGGDTTHFVPPATCTPVGGACGSDASCCSYGCVGGVCAANPVPGGICRTTNDCGYAIDAAGLHAMTCKSGACTVNTPGICRDDGDVCTSDLSCCSGNCFGATIYGAQGQCRANQPPVVDLGQAVQTVPYHQTVTLQATVTDPDGDPLIYGWTLVAPPGSTAQLSSQTAAAPTFYADVLGNYLVTLSVTDGVSTRPNRYTVTKSVTIVAVNTPPRVDAGAAVLHASRNVSQTLSGTVSDPDGDALTCKWSVTSPANVTQVVAGPSPCAGTFTGTFTPGPTPDTEGNWIATLEVTDGVNTVTASAAYTCVNDAPVANAGPAQVWNLGLTAAQDPTVPLAGAFTDLNGDAASTWAWTVVSAPPGSAVTTASLANAGTASASFVPDVAGRYVVQLAVCDRPGSCGLGTANVDVYRAIREFPDHRLVNATDYAHGVNRIALAGPDPAVAGGGKVWLYDPVAGTDVASAPLDAVPDTLAVTPDGTYAVAGSSLWLWVVKLSAAPPTVTKLSNAVGALGSIALVPSKNQALVFPRSSSSFPYFAWFTYPTASNWTPSGFTGNVGRADKEGANLYVLDTASYRITRYLIGPQSGFSLTSSTSASLPYGSGISNIWISQDSSHLFTSAGDIWAVSSSSLTAVGSLNVFPSFLDSLPDGQAAALSGSTLALFNTGLTHTADDALPLWGIAGVGYPVSADGGFLRADPADATKTIRHAVVHTTGAAQNRSGVVTFP